MAARVHKQPKSRALAGTGNNHPEAIYTQNFFDTKLNYIHQNPVRAGIVSSPEHYIYSSATNYPDNIGLLEMDFL